MKFMRLLLIVLAAALMTFGLSGMAAAFHDGGVAHCDGCHSMHNSPDNPVETNRNTVYLLKGADPSSTCLNCHAGGWDINPNTGLRSRNYHIFSSDGSVMSPGGDFFWLTQTYTVEIRTNTFVTFEGENTGHNVIALDYGLAVDSTNAQAPGGNYLSANLTCASCHDPHGSGDTAGGGQPISGSGSYGGTPPADTVFGDYRLLDTSRAPAPVAVADGTRGFQYWETDTSHVAYNGGMSDWCGGCHNQYLSGNDKHPVNEALAEYAANYQGYRATGDFNPAYAGTSYLPLVPYEDDQQTDPTSTVGANQTSQVACITCHRSHASAFQNMGRWQFETEYLADQIPTTLQVPGMENDSVPYYGRDVATVFGEYQRSLCNKCHVQD